MVDALVGGSCACLQRDPVKVAAWSTPLMDGEQVSVVESTLCQCPVCKTIWVEQTSEDGVRQ